VLPAAGQHGAERRDASGGVHRHAFDAAPVRRAAERIGAYAAGVEPWLIEVVAGIIEPGETPEGVVRREAVEEAGCEVLALEPIGRVLPSPGGDSELLHLFCGKTDSAGVGGLHGLDHEHEDIRAFVLPFDEALARVTQAGVTNANALIALQWLALNRDRLRDAWR